MQTVRMASFPTVSELKEREIQEKARIRQLMAVSAVLAVLCVVAFVMLGRQQAINTAIAEEIRAEEREGRSDEEEALLRYTNEAYLYKIYTENGDEYRAAHRKQLMQTERANLGGLSSEADKVDELLGR